jgi:hypothetical protein
MRQRSDLAAELRERPALALERRGRRRRTDTRETRTDCGGHDRQLSPGSSDRLPD